MGNVRIYVTDEHGEKIIVPTNERNVLVLVDPGVEHPPDYYHLAVCGGPQLRGVWDPGELVESEIQPGTTVRIRPTPLQGWGSWRSERMLVKEVRLMPKKEFERIARQYTERRAAYDIKRRTIDQETKSAIDAATAPILDADRQRKAALGPPPPTLDDVLSETVPSLSK